MPHLILKGPLDLDVMLEGTSRRRTTVNTLDFGSYGGWVPLFVQVLCESVTVVGDFSGVGHEDRCHICVVKVSWTLI
ncbi:hypothetical protein XENTR_v10016668 [Xenopus tropicalis]|nr:hypothetical protein XENTR_v10016668 [Xenopus tropicalis]